MSEKLSRQEFFDRKSAESDTWKYLNEAQQQESYRKYLRALTDAEIERRKQEEQDQAATVLRDQERHENLRKALAEQQRNERRRQKKLLNKLDALSSAKIAKSVISKFDLSEVLEVLDFFDSEAQLFEAVRSSHAELEPAYRKAIMTWYSDNTELQPDTLNEFSEIHDFVARCMNQGLSAICKSEALKPYLGTYHSTEESHTSHNGSEVGKIEKGRSWREISADDS